MPQLTNGSRVYATPNEGIPVFISSANNPFAKMVVTASPNDPGTIRVYITSANTPGVQSSSFRPR